MMMVTKARVSELFVDFSNAWCNMGETENSSPKIHTFFSLDILTDQTYLCDHVTEF